MHFLFGIFVLAIVLPLGGGYLKDTWTHREETHVTVAEDILERKLEVYHLATGHYPDGISALSFTNSDIEEQMLPDIQKIRYERTQHGYKIWYSDVLGYHTFAVYKDE